jgi:hypothetical protein
MFFSVVIIIEEVHVIKYENKWFPPSFGRSKSHLFELVHDYIILSVPLHL